MNYLENGILKYENFTRIANNAEIFPYGEGWDIALRTLANYPFGEKLYEVEDVGRVKLLVNIPPEKWGINPLSSRNYYCAVWDSDLINLQKLGYIDGVIPCNERDWRIDLYKKMIRELNYPSNTSNFNEHGDFIAMSNSKKKIIIKNPEHWFIKEYVEVYDKDFEGVEEVNWLLEYETRADKEFVLIPNGVKITKLGEQKFVEQSQNFKIHDDLKNRIDPLLSIKYYDTAIREIAILFESTLKEFHNSSNFGNKLIEEHLNYCDEIYGLDNFPGLKIYNQELKATNKFIRNEYMHNLKNISENEFQAILFRQNSLYSMILEIIKAGNK